MRIAECFYSIQGEGVTAGVPAVFLRLPGCNLMCGGPGGSLVQEGKATWWCDTEAVWKAGKDKSAQSVVHELPLKVLNGLRSRRTHLVVTGGEPTLYHNERSLIAFLTELSHHGIDPYLELETNATSVSVDYRMFHQINASPKLSNSGMPDAVRRVPEVIRRLGLHDYAWFKFVVNTAKDIEEIKEDWIRALAIDPNQIILMPGCDNIDDLPAATRFVMEAAMELGWRCCTRMQILAWNRTVGV